MVYWLSSIIVAMVLAARLLQPVTRLDACRNVLCCRFCAKGCPKSWVGCCILIYTHGCEQVIVYWWHLSLLFVMVLVWRFVSNSHKVMAAIIVVLLPSHCCGGFSTILKICCWSWGSPARWLQPVHELGGLTCPTPLHLLYFKIWQNGIRTKM